jgi:hypothetical protein
MKTTIELPDDLFVAVKRRAAEERSTLRAIIERGVRAQLRKPQDVATRAAKPTIKWVTVDGGLPRGVDLSDRAAMHDWLRRSK